MAWGDKGGPQDQGPWGRPPAGGQGGPRQNPGQNSGRPSGGGNNSGQGPDFDEWLRKSQDRLRQIFPSDGDEGGKGLLGIVLGAAVLIWLGTGIYFVKADQQGVVLRFGAYHSTTSPGLNYHWPYPIESVETPRVTAVNRVEVGFRSGGARTSKNDSGIPEEGLMLTGDENIVDVNFEVQWKISDAPAFLFNVRRPEDTVKAVAESAMREVIGKKPIADVLAEKKLEVEQDTKKLLQVTLNSYKAGVEIVSVNLLKADPPSQVIGAFRDVQTARADLETSRNQAEAYRNDILPKARGEAQQLILEAEAYKQEVIARSQGEASRFIAVYEQYKQAKDVTKKRIYLETMEDIMAGMNKLIIEQKGGVVPYLPLPQLKAASEEAKP